MFPAKGNTVWVNFREKLYLGKVLQTSPELDMVCVRISNYMDHVTRESNSTDFVAHSCPESNPSPLSNRQSSVVITCGLADIHVIDSNKVPNFQSNISHTSDENIERHSRDRAESNSIFIPLESNKREKILPDSAGHGSKQSISPEYDGNWSESFGINKLLRKTEIDHIKQSPTNVKWYRCWHCRGCLSNENKMCSHVFNQHKLDTLIDKDNWVVVGGIKGLDYDEVKYQEDTNITSLNGIHISTSSSRKRQFLDSAPGLQKSFSTSNEWQNQSQGNSTCGLLRLDASGTSNDFENSLNELQRSEMYWPTFTGFLSTNNIDLDNSEGISRSSFHPLHFNEFTNLSNDSIGYDRKLNIFQNILLQHHINSTLTASMNNSFTNDEWPSRFRSKSIPDQLISQCNQNLTNSLTEFTESDHIVLTPSKKSRMDIGVKKCRKVYGIDQRNLWCNQCKWKKACSRFSSDMNSN